MLSLKLAFRNLLAHRRRNAVLFIIVVLATAVTALFLAFSDGEIENLNKGTLALNDPSSDIVVYGAGLKIAQDQNEDWQHISTFSLKGYPGLLAQIKRFPFVKRAAVPTTGIALNIMAGGQTHQNFYLRGVDTEAPWLIQEHLRMRSGSFFDASDQPAVILHYKTASSFRMKPGDQVVITGKDLFGQVVAQPAVLKGYFMGEQDMPNLGEIGFINMAAYCQVSGFAPDETMSILIELRRGESLARSLQELRKWSNKQHLGLEFWGARDLPSRNQRAEDMKKIYSLMRLVLEFTTLIIIGVVTFGIMSLVSVNLFDRQREIGTYYCLGSEKGFLVRLYTIEMLLLNLSATLAGVLVGQIARQIINGLQFRTESSGLQIVFGGSQFVLGWSNGSLLFILIAMLIVTLITAVSTLGSRLRVSPVAALREAD